jgi:Cu(I)/Ag(I) efflux system membrane fusion protein
MNLMIIMMAVMVLGIGGCGPTKPATGTGASSPGMAGMEMPTAAGPKDRIAPAFTLTPVKRQLVGVTSGLVESRPLARVIRTVGRIEVDERAVAHLHIKFEGYIHELYVNTTGEQVEAGQPLFSVYSPDLLATQEEYLLALKGVRQLSGSSFQEVSEGAQSLLEATRKRLQLWDIEDSHIDDLERTGQVQSHLVIHTPSRGVVLEKTAVVGMKVMPGEELYKIADLSKVWLLADFYESEIAQIKIGQPADITVNAYPNEQFIGKVQYIYPYLEPETRATKVRFELSNPDGKLKPEMYANVEVQINLGRRLAVPAAAVLDSGTRQLVFVDKGEGIYEPREVKLGERADDRFEVVSGLQEGERIVTSANFLIDSESKLQAAVNAMGMVGMADWQMQKARMGKTGAGEMKEMPGMEGMEEQK